MKKLFMTILMPLLLLLFITGCGTTQYDFHQSVENIEKIEVVKIDGISTYNSEHEVSLIKEIAFNNIEDFLNDFRNIDCYKRFGDPGRLYSGEKAFKITYSDGEYELIIYDAQGSYENGKYYNTGSFGFDRVRFNNLIDEYSN